MIKFVMKKILIAGFLIFTLCILFVISRSNKEITSNLHTKDNSFIEGVRILQKENGVTVWTLIAKRADFIEDKAQLSDIMVLLHKSGFVIYSDKGTYDFSNRNFTVPTKIVAKSKDYTILAESIDYEASSGEIKSEGWIEVEGKGFRFTGKGMNADSKKVRILKDVKAIFYK